MVTIGCSCEAARQRRSGPGGAAVLRRRSPPTALRCTARRGGFGADAEYPLGVPTSYSSPRNAVACMCAAPHSYFARIPCACALLAVRPGDTWCGAVVGSPSLAERPRFIARLGLSGETRKTAPFGQLGSVNARAAQYRGTALQQEDRKRCARTTPSEAPHARAWSRLRGTTAPAWAEGSARSVLL